MRTTETSEILVILSDDTIIIDDLLVLFDVAQGLDEDTPFILFGLAVRLARMVHVLLRNLVRIDASIIFKHEDIEHLSLGVTLVSFLSGDAVADVFADNLIFLEVASGKATETLDS